MHKICLISLLLAAVVAMTSGQKIRLFRPGSRARTVPFAHAQLNSFQYPMAAMDGFDYNYINPLPMFNYPMRSRMPLRGGFGRRIPDGEYRTAHGIATVDGSDVSMDSHW
ncbi:hypothetical protein PoB_006422500 [Plakobranchus ocellatus]|uniref:Uncharacterized protein n=1 Tax=Plakobranchus ocellatus TaxID=259542 RepID=A0AAV4D0R8_9GAST|nr:hypothetical protein PoB_006422500 [Plakobranchus ocellatus]